MSPSSSGATRFAALRNAINAKLTLVTLSEEESKRALLRAKMVCVGGDDVEPRVALERVKNHVPPIDTVLEAMNEFEFHSLHARAMQQLGIEPYLPDEEWETLEEHPLEQAYEIVAEDLEGAQDYFLATHSISVELDIEK